MNKAFEHNLDEDASKQIEFAEKSLFELANERELEGGPKALIEGLDSDVSSKWTFKKPDGGLNQLFYKSIYNVTNDDRHFLKLSDCGLNTKQDIYNFYLGYQS